MSPEERSAAARLLVSYTDRMGGCDDFQLLNTKANRDMCRDAREHCEPGSEFPFEDPDPGAEKFIFSGMVVCLYLAARLERATNSPEAVIQRGIEDGYIDEGGFGLVLDGCAPGIRVKVTF